MLVIDGYQGTLSGALKGINLVKLVFVFLFFLFQYSTLICYYAICVPIVGYFTYDWGLGNGLVGIWQAFGLTNVLLAILYTILLFTSDWDKESAAIISRVKKENEMQKSTVVQVEDDLYDM